MKNYVVNCYTCEHNGQETCKGCNTLLNGEDEPYENWELREDLNEKDQQISDLEAKLAESEETIKYLKGIKRYDIGEMLTENTKLKQQLAEKEKEIEIKTETLLEKDKELEYYKSWFADDDYEMHNQDKISFALEQLEKVKELYKKHLNYKTIYDEFRVQLLEEDVESLITELKEKKDV